MGDSFGSWKVYFAQNWRSDVSVLMTDSGRILERIKYSAYGVATRIPVADFNRDGIVDFFDDADYDDCYTGAGCPAGQTADMNLDGFVDSFDYDEWDLNFAEQGSTARGVLSQSTGSAAVNRIGYAGYFFEPSTQQYLVRHRELDPLVGVWDERDPMGYHDGSNLYMYVSDNPVNGRDPMGLRREMGGCASGCHEHQAVNNTSEQPVILPITCTYPTERTFQACRDWAACILTRRRTPRGTCFDSAVDAAATCCWTGWNSSESTCLTALNDQYFECGNSTDPCFRVAPMEPTREVCDFYGECETYRLANSRCFCLCMGSDPWSNFVRACLQCKYRMRIPPSRAHNECYDEANRLFTQPTLDKLGACAALCWTYQMAHCAITIVPLTNPDGW